MLSSGKKVKKKECGNDSPNQEYFNDASTKPKKSIAFSDVIDVVSPIETNDNAKVMHHRRGESHSRVAFLPRAPTTKTQKLRAPKTQRIVPPPIMPTRMCHNKVAHAKDALQKGMSESDNCSCACHACSCCLYHGHAASSRDLLNDPYHRSPYFRGGQYSDLDLCEFDPDIMATLRGAIDDILSNRVANKLLGTWNNDSVLAGSRNFNVAAERKFWCPTRDRQQTAHNQTTYAQTDCLQNIYACLNEIRHSLRKSRGRD